MGKQGVNGLANSEAYIWEKQERKYQQIFRVKMSWILFLFTNNSKKNQYN